ncbi:MAG: hypothetical protein LH632_00840 [Rhodoferax sp.]|nr:hypothetical protein [Rhodoferax sp.]
MKISHFAPLRAARSVGLIAILAFSLGPGTLLAQGMRDPTLVPPVVTVPGSAENAGEKPQPPPAMTVIVREGQPYVVVGGRLYGQGQKLGDARIERISETEIWLREGKVVRKIARFAGVQRKTLP